MQRGKIKEDNAGDRQVKNRPQKTVIIRGRVKTGLISSR